MPTCVASSVVMAGCPGGRSFGLIGGLTGLTAVLGPALAVEAGEFGAGAFAAGAFGAAAFPAGKLPDADATLPATGPFAVAGELLGPFDGAAGLPDIPGAFPVVG